MDADFKEIGHSGGRITFRISTDEAGNRGFSVAWSHSRPTPAAIVGIHALEQGIPVIAFNMGGIGQLWDPPPPKGCLPVFLCSDSHGKFGHKCDQCSGYWRSSAFPRVCPYCGNMPEPHHTLSDAQRRYVEHYCKTLVDALSRIDNGEVIIDMDAIATSVDTPDQRPEFYVSEEQQQHQFDCEACGGFNDVIGAYVFCSSCGTRNDHAILRTQMEASRTRLNQGNKPEDCVRDAASHFDSFIGQISNQLVYQIPMTKARKSRLQRNRFHKFEEVCSVFLNWFDIDLAKGINKSDRDFINLMFLRRHVYEHNGGEVDAKYIADSGDSNVRLKQLLREKPEDVHRFLGLINKLGHNAHTGFQDIFPPIDAPIKTHREIQERIKRFET
ncbi:hypothetical protein HCU64_19360 [Methylobacterium sp. C25]|uniref:hypothetical protein n=1 Tax=Methylobacterium sp. C25 TaxID=2721622 RepID=UPI001F31CF25|nr:hypothetical protein [Methylobacterium sp. C25]MCE4225915.1 hypothetical protein [Methylobacterium sp. C25]